MNRETIMNALLALVTSNTAFASTSRRVQLWSDVASSDKPALYISERSDTYYRASEATPETVTMDVDLIIYTEAGKDQSKYPISTLNELIDAVDAALLPNPMTSKLTLGGLVSHCWIEGKIMKDSGDIDGDGIAIIPVKILVPRN